MASWRGEVRLNQGSNGPFYTFYLFLPLYASFLLFMCVLGLLIFLLTSSTCYVNLFKEINQLLLISYYNFSHYPGRSIEKEE